MSREEVPRDAVDAATSGILGWELFRGAHADAEEARARAEVALLNAREHGTIRFKAEWDALVQERVEEFGRAEGSRMRAERLERELAEARAALEDSA